MSATLDRRPLTERLRPARLAEVLGNGRAIRDLRTWAQAWDQSEGSPPRLRAAILEGPPGVGKTTSALAVAADFGWTLVEMNASDARNQSAIEEVAGRAARTHTLGNTGVFRAARAGGRTLILLDEADCLTGRASEESAAKAAPPSLREFLRGRYRTVDALAVAWGLGVSGSPPAFASWEAVPTTGGRGAWTKLAAAQRDLSDWRGSSRSRDSSDRGGLGAIAKLVRETRQPLLLTVNDVSPLTRYSPIFRQGAQRIRFYPVDPTELRTLLTATAAREGYRITAPVMDAIIRRSQGDVRAAVTDLEAVGILPTDDATARELLGTRDLSTDYYEVTREVLTQPRFYRGAEIRDRLDSTPDDLLPWIEENLPRATSDPAARFRGFEVLAQAEQFLAWARRQRVFGLWPFATEVMTGGVSVAIAGHSHAPDLAFPQFLGAMGRSRAARASRTAILTKVGKRVHLSRRKGVEIFIPYLDRIFASDRRGPTPEPLALLRRRIARELGFTGDDVAFLMGLEPESSQVREVLGEPPVDAEGASDARGDATDSPPPAAPVASPKKAGRTRVQRKLIAD
jgi:DNA polymerase III delta prime subunit